MDNHNRQPEELYSQSINAGKRKYFFDVKQTKNGDKFITIAESRKVFDGNTGTFTFDKHKMFLYKEDFEKFQRGLSNAFSFIATGVIPEEVDDFQDVDLKKTDEVLDNIDFNI